MLFPKIYITMIATAALCSVPPISIKKCSLEKCGGKYHLKDPEHKNAHVGVGNVKIKILEHPSTVDIGLYKKVVQGSYCYDGTFLDPNTGCDTFYHLIEKTPSQAREMQVQKSCSTGFQCEPYGDCWAGDSEKCLQKDDTIHRIGPTTLKWVGVSWQKRFYHSCTMSWMCHNFKISPNVFVEVYPYTRYYFYSKENEKIMLDYTLFEQGSKLEEGYMYYLLDPPPKPTQVVLDGKCYSSSPENIKCIVTQENEWKGKVFNLNSFPTSTIRSNVITIIGKITTIINETVTTLTSNHDGRQIVTEEGEQRAPNIESLKETINSISLLQMQSLYNEFENNNEIKGIKKLLIRLIREATMKDHTAMARILDGHYSTRWLNWDYFEKCPCIQYNFTSDSNCQLNERFVEGKITNNNDTSTCKTLSGLPVHSIDILSMNPLDSEIIISLNPQESNGESSEWDELVRAQMEQLFTDTTSTTDKERTSSGMVSLLNNYKLIDFTYWFFLISSILSWFLLCLSIRARHPL